MPEDASYKKMRATFVETMAPMSVNEALDVAGKCMSDEYPPTNRNVLVRALYTLQCYVTIADADAPAYDACRAAIHPIIGWWVSLEGYVQGLSVHDESIKRAATIAGGRAVKEIWQEYYDEAIDMGMSESEAGDHAEAMAYEYYASRADGMRDDMKYQNE